MTLMTAAPTDSVIASRSSETVLVTTTLLLFMNAIGWSSESESAHGNEMSSFARGHGSVNPLETALLRWRDTRNRRSTFQDQNLQLNRLSFESAKLHNPL